MRIRPDQKDAFINWMRSFADRSEEVLAAMTANDLIAESVYLFDADGESYALMIQVSEDLEATSSRFLSSTLPIDVEAREVLPKLTEFCGVEHPLVALSRL